MLAVALLTVATLFLLWIVALRREVRQRKAAEAALRDEIAFKAALLDGIPQPVYVRDAALRLMACNRRYEELIGTSRETLRGMPLEAVGHLRTVVTDMPELSSDYRKVIASGVALSKDRCVQIQGAKRHVLNSVSPLQAADGAVKGLVGSWVDLTERHEMLAELGRAKEHAEAANRAKSTFLASVSHEIRTPMNAITGMLELTLTQSQSHLSPEDRLQLITAHKSALALLALIDDILDLSKLEAGKFRIHPVAASLPALVEEVRLMFGPVAAQKHLSLTSVVHPGVGPAHMVDSLRFRQILANLVSNAVRFTDSGSIVVELSALPARDGEQAITVTVADTGIGVPRDAQARLFEPFEQLHGQSRPHSGGTGLGLAICRRLAAAMGGELRLTSEAGHGTRVQLTLALGTAAAPAPEPDAPAPRRAVACPQAARRILVVDDHAPNRLLLQKQLERLGHHVVTATDGSDALARLAQGTFDLIVCDCAMPVMNGLEFTRKVRERGDAVSRVPIVGCTASALHEDHEQALDAGMNTVLVKPVGLDALSAALQALDEPAGASRRVPMVLLHAQPAPCRGSVDQEPSATPAGKPDRSWCDICRAMNVQCDQLDNDPS
ncbi:hybrid sensor histidine kinase/response regulator [Cupriavidus sp. IDO]|nr:hybrid sensor histidine kinase/response regulator [Cupriavidus sp. IDO]